MGGNQASSAQSWVDGERSLPREKDKKRSLAWQKKLKGREMADSKVKKDGDIRDPWDFPVSIH